MILLSFFIAVSHRRPWLFLARFSNNIFNLLDNVFSLFARSRFWKHFSWPEELRKKVKPVYGLWLLILKKGSVLTTDFQK